MPKAKGSAGLPLVGGGGRQAAAKKKTTSAHKAGLQFPPARMVRYIRKNGYSKRVSPEAGVYMAAVLEYVSGEILELAGGAAREAGKSNIRPRDIFIAIAMDEDLKRVFSKSIIAHGGALPGIQTSLLKGSEEDGAKA